MTSNEEKIYCIKSGLIILYDKTFQCCLDQTGWLQFMSLQQDNSEKKGVRLTRYFQNSNSKKYLPPISRISFENMCYGGAKCGVNYDSKSGKI